MPMPAAGPALTRGAVATSHSPFPSVSYVNHEAKMTSPCCVRLTPQPDSEFAGDRHHRSVKFVGGANVSPTTHVGTGEANTSRVIGFDCVMPVTVYVKVPLFASLNANVAVPTGVATTCDGFHGLALNA